MITTTKQIEPFYPIHPGEILKEEIESRGISQRKLAKKMDVAYTYLNEVLNCKRPVNTEFALLIEAALDIEPNALVYMQVQYNMQIARKDKNPCRPSCQSSTDDTDLMN
jgi:addiction module HigA family antidote